MSMNTPAVVMDNGTGLTKLGFAGNDSPSFVFPTAIATSSASSKAGKGARGSSLASKRGLEDLDFTLVTKHWKQVAPNMVYIIQSSTDKLKIGIKWNGFGKVQFSST